MEVGERRLVARRPVHLHFGKELTPEYVQEEFIKRKVRWKGVGMGSTTTTTTGGEGALILPIFSHMIGS